MTATPAGGELGEEDLVPISALQHFAYCPRQCALIHVEQVFDENLFTLRGQAVHRLVDEPESRVERGVRVERALPLHSARLGLVGKADVVEFGPDGTAYPVEYKHGRRRPREHDDVQVAAQALCLEEMTGMPVPAGAVFHHTSRRRREVPITPALRARAEALVGEVRRMLRAKGLPSPPADARCRHCSLLDVCQPHMVAAGDRLRRLRDALFDPEDDA